MLSVILRPAFEHFSRKNKRASAIGTIALTDAQTRRTLGLPILGSILWRCASDTHCLPSGREPYRLSASGLVAGCRGSMVVVPF